MMASVPPKEKSFSYQKSEYSAMNDDSGQDRARKFQHSACSSAANSFLLRPIIRDSDRRDPFSRRVVKKRLESGVRNRSREKRGIQGLEESSCLIKIFSKHPLSYLSKEK
jgi:hypothetical protein